MIGAVITAAGLAATAVAAVWWALAIVAGLWLGRGDRPAAGVRPVLTEAQMATSLPEESPTRIALQRLWPIAATALIAAGLGIRFPGVAAIGTGFALLIAVAWRGRESAVEAIEQRDGARFYVLPGSAFKPLKLMRSPGLHRGRPPHPKPPPPPPATS